MARHVWDKKSKSLNVCKYCEAEKRFVDGPGGGKVVKYVEKGSKKAVDDMPSCIEKNGGRKPKKTAKKLALKAGKANRSYEPKKTTSTTHIYAAAPILFGADQAAAALGFDSTEALFVAVKAGDVAKPLDGNRWTKDDLGAYVSILKTRRVTAIREAEEELERLESEKAAAEKIEAEKSATEKIEAEKLELDSVT